MKKPIVERVLERFADFQMESMSNLRSKSTGIEGAVIWISAGEFSGKEIKHGPRIKVVLGDKITTDGLKNAITVRLSTPPEVLGDLPGKVKSRVIDFVELNKDLLLQHWNGEVDTQEMLEQLKKV